MFLPRQHIVLRCLYWCCDGVHYRTYEYFQCMLLQCTIPSVLSRYGCCCAVSNTVGLSSVDTGVIDLSLVYIVEEFIVQKIYYTKVPFCFTSLPKLSLDITTFIVLVSFLTSVITQLLILSIRMCRIKQRKKYGERASLCPDNKYLL